MENNHLPYENFCNDVAGNAYFEETCPRMSSCKNYLTLDEFFKMTEGAVDSLVLQDQPLADCILMGWIRKAVV